MLESGWLMARRRLNQEALPASFYAAAVAVAALIGALAITSVPQPFLILAAALVLPAIAAIFLKPEIGLLILVFVTFTRAFEVLMGESSGDLSLYTVYLALLVGVLAVRRVFFGEKIEGWERSAILFGSFGVMILASTFYAINKAVVISELILYIKDILMLLLIVLMLRRGTQLRQVIWTLLAAGIFLGTISVYQQLTGSFDNTFLGFGDVKVANIIEDVEGNRVGGPGIDPNLYGQMMLILVPLAWDRIRYEKKPALRVAASWALLVCVAAIIFTFSRGNFIGLVAIVALMVVLRPPKPIAAVIVVVAAVLFFQLVPAEYMQRITTLTTILPGAGGDESLSGVRSAQQEISFRGRLSENLVGIMLTRDHPIIGVGYRNFKDYYQSYSRTLGLDPRREGRSAHNLYLEFSAELGIIGVLWLIALNWATFSGLFRARNAFLNAGMPGHAGMALAMGIGLISLLFTSIFLHMVYPRYFWLFYAVALAIPQAASNELDRAYLDSGWKQFDSQSGADKEWGRSI